MCVFILAFVIHLANRIFSAHAPYCHLYPVRLYTILPHYTLKGRRFQTIEEIQENATRDLRAITESAFQEAFKKWKKPWERCIASRGEYFEGNSA